ncbi:MAG: GspE/PulE family protein [Spirochaetales bacterium]|nr:GspE/PulE family protein [Spirochaetales bacterium]
MIHKIKNYQPVPAAENQYSIPFMEKNRTLVLREDQDEILVGVEKRDPDLEDILIRYHQGAEKNVKFVLIESRDLSLLLARLVSDQGLSKGTLEEDQRSLSLDHLAGDAPVINLVNSIIMEGIEQGASDIHLEKFRNRLVVRYRVDGILHVGRELEPSVFSYISSRIKIMAHLNIMETRLPQDGRITVQLGSDEADLRVSIVPLTGEGESIVLRILHRTMAPMGVDQLGYSESHLRELLELAEKSHGLVLVTGPTGCGKSTTLNSLLRHIYTPGKKFISIEDPVEYVVDGIDQIQTNDEIGLSFSSILRRVLRQDPNVIMIGEIRDRETADLAIRSALTGHLVFSTLHTNDALSAVPRLMNMGVEPYLLASVLKGITAQRLVRKVCPVCGKKRELTEREREIFKSAGMAAPDRLSEGIGCPQCDNSGYSGRTLINEIISVTEEWEDLISRGDGRDALRRNAREKGIESLLADGLTKAAAGITTLLEVERVVKS